MLSTALVLAGSSIVAGGSVGDEPEAMGSLIVQSSYARIVFKLPDLGFDETCSPGQRLVHAKIEPGVYPIRIWDGIRSVECELAIHVGKTCYLVVGADAGRSTVKYAEGRLTEPVHAETLVSRKVPGIEYRYRVRIPDSLANEIDAAPYDRAPVPVEWVPAEWSEQAIRAGLHCDVTALVRVEADGTVSRVYPLIEVPVLRDTVAQLPEELIFRPARRGGEPVAGWVFWTMWFADRWLRPEARLSCWRPGAEGPAN